MTEWIITSCVLIAMILGVRFLLKDRISGRLRYGLWLLVLIRLLIPFSLPSDMSVMNLLPEKTPEQVTVGYVGYELPDTAVAEPNPDLPPDLWQAIYEDNLQEYNQQIQQAKADTGTPVTLGSVLTVVWVVGIAITGCVLLICNCRFALRLRASREKLDASETQLPVYITDHIQTPCLFGIFRPAIYLTPELSDKQILRHVLLHELIHHRHLDHIWSALRCVCLALHWYNPLVWVAAVLSKQDAEVACDEAVICQLGEDNRSQYGKTLVSMTCATQGEKGLLVAATTMVSGKKVLKERVIRIASNPKMKKYALIAVILAASIAVGCTFTGAQTPAEAPEDDKIYVTEIFKDALYLYEGEGFGSQFFIRLHSNGTFAYSVGSLSSYYGTGTWTLNKGILTMKDDTIVGLPFVNYYRIEGDALIWQEKNSTGVMYLKLRDGDKFTLAADSDAGGIIGEHTFKPDDPMIGGVVNMDGVGYQYVGRHEGPMPEGFIYKGTVYRDVTGVPAGDYAASVIIGGCRLYTSAQDPDTAYVQNPEGYGSAFILKLERIKEKTDLPTALNEDEIKQLQSTLSWGGYLRCMNVPFTSFQELDLYQLLSMGSIATGKPITQVELDYVNSQWGALAQEVKPEEIRRIPVSELNAFLGKYYGYSMDVLSSENQAKNSLSAYLEETDSYYLPPDNQPIQSITVDSGIRYGEVMYVRYFRQGQAYVAKLWDVDGNYVFLNILKEG